MAYCNSCGTEIKPDAAFCSNCGTEITEKEATPKEPAETETAACEKCDSQISVNAERCPNCEYEPGAHGIIATILIALGFGNVAFMALLFVVVWILVISVEMTVADGLSASAGTVLFSLPGLGVLYLAALGERKTPTGRTRSWGEFWNDVQSE